MTVRRRPHCAIGADCCFGRGRLRTGPGPMLAVVTCMRGAAQVASGEPRVAPTVRTAPVCRAAERSPLLRATARAASPTRASSGAGAGSSRARRPAGGRGWRRRGCRRAKSNRSPGRGIASGTDTASRHFPRGNANEVRPVTRRPGSKGQPLKPLLQVDAIRAGDFLGNTVDYDDAPSRSSSPERSRAGHRRRQRDDRSSRPAGGRCIPLASVCVLCPSRQVCGPIRRPVTTSGTSRTHCRLDPPTIGSTRKRSVSQCDGSYVRPLSTTLQALPSSRST